MLTNTMPVTTGRKPSIDVQRIDTDSLERLFQTGTAENCRATLTRFFEEIDFCRIDSLLLRLYIAMDIYILARSFSRSIGVTNEEFVSRFGCIDDIQKRLASNAATIEFFHALVLQCIQWRIALAGESGSDVIQKAKEYIDQRYTQEDISLKSVAAAMNFSPTYFSSLFKKETGTNFINYLTQARIHKAKSLLCCTSKMVYEVAYEVGFRDYRYFSQIFKKYTGQTPREFQCSSNSVRPRS